MKSITLVLYARPSIQLLKLKGFMKDNGKGIPKKLWEGTTLLYCQTCARLTIERPELYTKHRVELLLSHIVDIGRMSQLQEVVISDGDTSIRYKTPQDFCSSGCVLFEPVEINA